MEEDIDIFVCVVCTCVCLVGLGGKRDWITQYFDFTFNSLNNNQMYRLLIFDIPVYFSHALINNIAFLLDHFIVPICLIFPQI